MHRNSRSGTMRPAAAAALVELTSVERKYGGTVTALGGVNLTIAPGESVAVLGPSGCGKSTLLNLIAGLDRPTAGTVSVGGTQIGELGEAASAKFRRRRIGMVFQFFHLLDDLTVLDNVLLPTQLVRRDRDESRSRAHALLGRLGMEARTHAFPDTLSGGERQRVAITRALINEPALLLADEPTGAVDTAAGQHIAALLRAIHAAGQTVILVTHDRSLARSVATRTIELQDGRVAADSGAPAARTAR